MSAGPFRSRAFTLIELLVVVAIIALLISILLPSLSAAREQAKVAKCLANLRSLMQATHAYFNDYNSMFPFLVKRQGTQMGVCEWAYGGKTCSSFWRTYRNGVFYFRVDERPLNRYLMGGQTVYDLSPEQRTEVPVLRCPSDQTTNMRRWLEDEPDSTKVSSYDDTGTSYYFNLHSLVDTNRTQAAWNNDGAGWPPLFASLLRDVFQRQNATFTFFQEDEFAWGVYQRIQTMGSHRRFSKHSMAFLDGHAEHRFVDTRGSCGPGWEAINQNWIRRFGVTKPIYYNMYWRNCDPPR